MPRFALDEVNRSVPNDPAAVFHRFGMATPMWAILNDTPTPDEHAQYQTLLAKVGRSGDSFAVNLAEKASGAAISPSGNASSAARSTGAGNGSSWGDAIKVMAREPRPPAASPFHSPIDMSYLSYLDVLPTLPSQERWDFNYNPPNSAGGPPSGTLMRIANNWPVVADSWRGASGTSHTFSPAPDGWYVLPEPATPVGPQHPDYPSYLDKTGHAWFQRIFSLVPNGRNGLGIHPDGNLPGTKGCIGIACDNTADLYGRLGNTAGILLHVTGAPRR